MGIKQLLSNLVKINGKKRALLVIPLLLIFSGYGCFVDTTLPEIELLPTDTLSPTSTFTPVPTEVSTDAPTKTIPYTSTFTSTPTKTIPPTSTYTPVPTETLIPTPEPTATNAPVLGALIRIKAVNKQDESWEVKCNRAQFFAYGQVILQVVDSIADLTDRYGIIQRVTLLFFMIQMDKR